MCASALASLFGGGKTKTAEAPKTPAQQIASAPAQAAAVAKTVDGTEASRPGLGLGRDDTRRRSGMPGLGL